MELNHNMAECLLKVEGFLATKVANVCSGTTGWVYFPPSVIVLNILMTGIFTLVVGTFVLGFLFALSR